MLQIDNISSGYGKKQVLFDISFEVKTGEVLLLSGGNGSGKSTLLKCIYNLLPLWKGSIFFHGEQINFFKSNELIKRGIIYIPQKGYCFDNMSVEENLQISGFTLPKAELKNRISNVLEITGLTNKKRNKPFVLSGGEKKMLAFSMGLIHKPKLLLFDEPFSGLDQINFEVLLDLFQKSIVNLDTTVIIVEHKNAFRNFFTKNIILELGKIKQATND